MTSASSLVFSAISPMLAQAFGVSLVLVNMCANIFNATYVPVTFIAMWAYKHADAALILRFASLIFIVGSWIRYVCKSTDTFLPLLIG